MTPGHAKGGTLQARARLVAGDKPPHTRWTFLEIPGEALAAWAPNARVDVHVRIGDAAFHGTLRRTAGGAWRVPHARTRALFAALPASMRRAWATFVGEAQRAETREARAARAVAGIRAKAWPR